MSKGKQEEDLTLCDFTNNKECEKVRTWQDENSIIHKEPFYLYPKNHLAMEIYERTILLSIRQTMQWMKGDKRMEANVSTLDKIDFVIKHYVPAEFTQQETIDLIDSVVMIYNLKLKYHMS